MAYKALQVADEIMRLANEEDMNITLLKLIKMCYFVEGWSLGILDKEMFEDDVKAWMHGPVIPSVYHKFKVYNGSAISYKPSKKSITDEQDKKLIKAVWDTYKSYDAFTLRDLTHQEGNPWEEIYDASPNKTIPKDKIKQFYKNKHEKSQ